MSSGFQRVMGTGMMAFLPVDAMCQTLEVPRPCAPSGPCAAKHMIEAITELPSPRARAMNSTGVASSLADERNPAMPRAVG
eukprot:scaffold36275_cov154-Isochrysis_galbana.AAC.28